jgi:hypothetical protein
MAYDGMNDFHWYLDHQEELVKRYNGRVLAIRNCEVIGDYSNEDEALGETLKRLKMGQFIIQFCSPGPDAYTIHNPLLAATL